MLLLFTHHCTQKGLATTTRAPHHTTLDHQQLIAINLASMGLKVRVCSTGSVIHAVLIIYPCCWTLSRRAHSLICMHTPCRPPQQQQEDFDTAAERIKPVKGPNNDEMLELYGLFKQATVGDNTTGRFNTKLGLCTHVILCCNAQAWLAFDDVLVSLQPSLGCWIRRAGRSGMPGNRARVSAACSVVCVEVARETQALLCMCASAKL